MSHFLMSNLQEVAGFDVEAIFLLMSDPVKSPCSNSDKA
jgi:hypothetical protein